MAGASPKKARKERYSTSRLKSRLTRPRRSGVDDSHAVESCALSIQGVADTGIPSEQVFQVPPGNHVYRPLKGLVPYARNAKKHLSQQIQKLKGSLAEYGWTRPIAIR